MAGTVGGGEGPEKSNHFLSCKRWQRLVRSAAPPETAPGPEWSGREWKREKNSGLSAVKGQTQKCVLSVQVDNLLFTGII